MKLTDITGTRENEPFKMKGCAYEYKIIADPARNQLLVTSGDGLTPGGTIWTPASPTIALRIIAGAPDNIIRLPNLTQKERAQLAGFYMLGFKWLARDADGIVCAFVDKPRKCPRVWITDPLRCLILNFTGAEDMITVCRLVSWEDEEPLNIALAIEEA